MLIYPIFLSFASQGLDFPSILDIWGLFTSVIHFFRASYYLGIIQAKSKDSLVPLI